MNEAAAAAPFVQFGWFHFDDEVLEWMRDALHASHAEERREHEEGIRRLRGTSGRAQWPPTAAVSHSPRLSSNRATWGFRALHVTPLAKRFASLRPGVARTRLSSAVSCRQVGSVSMALGVSDGAPRASGSPGAAADPTESGATLRLSMSRRA